LITWISDDNFLIVGSALIILGDKVQYTVEQSFFFKKRFKLAEQRWRAYTWGGERFALRIFLQMQLSILYS
jgi:hypothetical protein